MSANDDDLYGDLDDAAVVAKAAPSQSSSQTSTAAAKSFGAPPMMMSQPEIAKLQQQIKSLKAENDTLQKNIGILYRTAKSELERKDRTIEQLQNEIDSMRR